LLERSEKVAPEIAAPPTGPGGCYRVKTGRGNLWPARWLMTHSDRLPVPIAAVRDIRKLGDRERLIEIGNDVVDVLDADRKPNVALGNACARLLFGRELGMCRAGRVNGE
jgi:hypothetical protein